MRAYMFLMIRGSEIVVYSAMVVRFPEIASLEDYVIFGGNVLMSQGSRVGAWSMIQTGCRFRKDIPPFIVAAKEPTTYYGVNSFILSA